MLNGNQGLKIAPKTNAKLSKQHTKFNKLIEKIERLKEQRAYLQTAFDTIRKRYFSDIVPLAEKATTQMIETALALDRAFDAIKLGKRDRELLEEIISENIEAAIETRRTRNASVGEDDANDAVLTQLEAIYQKYAGQTFDQMKEEENEMQAEMMEMMFGVKIDPSKIDDDDYMSEVEKQYNERFFDDEEGDRPKTQKQLEKEAARTQKAAEAATKMQKDLRSVYTDLVKELHPDGEQDPARQAEKTEMMKRVTAAYEEKDLYALLQIQLEIEQLDTAALSNLSDDRMNAFIEVLNKQVRELEAEMNVNTFDNPLYEQFFAAGKFSESKFQKMIKETKSQIKSLEELERGCMNPTWLKGYLKEVRRDVDFW